MNNGRIIIAEIDNYGCYDADDVDPDDDTRVCSMPVDVFTRYSCFPEEPAGIA